MKYTPGHAFLVLVIIAVVNFAIDMRSYHTRKCLSSSPGDTHFNILSLLMVHHLLSTFLLLGWIVPDRRVLILFILGNLLMLLEWSVFGYCRLTRMLNQMCRQEEGLPFRDLFWWSGTKEIVVWKWNGKGTSLFVVLAVVFLLLGILHLLRLSRLP